MLGITDLKTGVIFVYKNDPYQVMSHEHSKVGRGGAVLRVKLRNLRTGAALDETFKGNDHFPEAQLERRKAQYLYTDGQNFAFMDQESFEQFELAKSVIGDQANYLAEGAEADVMIFEGQPMAITLPIKVTLTVADTVPGFKGDTAARSYKPATLETGAVVNVPFHVKTGDKLVIDTRTGDYVERG